MKSHPSLKWLPEMGRESTFPRECNPERLSILLQVVPHHSQKATASCPVWEGAENRGCAGRWKRKTTEDTGELEGVKRRDQNTLYGCMKFSIKSKMLKKI